MHPTPRFRSSTLAAFTLIELLTVIAIIGILAAIIIPTVSKVRATARNAQCVSRLRDWGGFIQLFANDNKGVYQLQNWTSNGNDAYKPYFNKTIEQVRSMGTCPLDPENLTDPARVAYAMVWPSIGNINTSISTTVGGTVVNGNLGLSLGKIRAPSQFLLMVDSMKGTSTRVRPTDADLTTYLSPLFGGTNPGDRGGDELAKRHGGRKINALAADGSVKAITGSAAGSGDQSSIYEMRTTWCMLN